MGFAERLSALRVSRGLTRADLADRAGISRSYLARCETGGSQPTLEILRNLAVALAVSADDLLFDPAERKKRGDDLRHLIEAVSTLDKKERESIRSHIEAVLYRHEAEAARRTRKKPGPRS